MWDDGPIPVLDGVGVFKRELLVTSVVDAAPLYRHKSPGPSLWPLVAALAVTIMFIGSIFTPWAVVWGAIPIAAALIAWFWPERPRARAEAAR
ncbi:MAG: hypothetical protein JO157_05280 [Acetobacteraceae bacterium]|nr:hypothetical protein [Acetobacteraceae bacterium]